MIIVKLNIETEAFPEPNSYTNVVLTVCHNHTS